jgi:hypothetical protein
MPARLPFSALVLAAALLAAEAAGLSAQVVPDSLPPRDTVSTPAPDTSGILLPRDTVPRPAAPDTIAPAAAPGDTIPVPGAPAAVAADTIPPVEIPAGLPGDTLALDSLGERVPPPDPEADAIIQELRELEGYVATEYLGERAIYRTDEGVLRLIGQAQVEREGDRLNADSIIYRDYADLVEAHGNPKVAGEAQELTGDVLYYDLVTRRATALGARTEVTESATWIVTGDVTVESGDDTRIYATAGHFTTCDLAIPHYHFEADRIKIVRDKYLVGRPARLYFGRVPVMVLPFFVQSLEQGRRSGFIVPRFSLTDVVRNSGHTREISDLGWYWAVNDYLGAQLTGRWRSGAYTALTGNLDWRWRRQFLDGNFGFTRYWQQSGRREFSLDARASWRPDERTSMSGSGRFTTSSEFIRESTIDPLEATQDLNSSFSISRRFDWGTMALGATGRQSMADGGLSYTLPSFSISPNPITLFRPTNPAEASWYNNASINWGFRATRSGTEGEASLRSGTQDRQETDLNGNVSLSLGRLNLSTSGQLNQAFLEEVSGFEFGNEVISPCPDGGLEGLLQLPCRRRAGGNRDVGRWNASVGFQQPLIGQTTLTPSLGFSQEVRRDSLTHDEYLQAPTRMNLGVSLSTAIFGLYDGGVGPFASIRHRMSPTLSFTYSPAVQQNAAQDTAFGVIESRTQNVLTFGFNQTWEAKLKRPQRTEQDDSLSVLMDTTTVGDTLAARSAQGAVPQEEEKVTLLSLNTSSLTYDFTRAQETGSGFTNTTISNSITSDYLQGLTIQITHDLFDQSRINPDSVEQRGQLGRFAPRLSSLSTGFNLGPNSAIFRWLGLRGNARSAATEGNVPGTEGPGPGDTGGSSTATGNPQGFGSGQWRASVDYSFSRPRRTWDPDGLRDDRSDQTVNLSTSMPLTPNWSADWRTSYSISETEFSGHSLNFSRDLHRWRANFSFFQTATGNSGFQFYVELIDNTDLQFEYRERNLGIDR